MNCTLTLDVTAPDGELARADECYATLQREIELPFTPVIGLTIALEPEISARKQKQYGKLFGAVEDFSGHFQIERMVYEVETGRFILRLSHRFEPTLDGFYAQIKYLETFFDFTLLGKLRRGKPAATVPGELREVDKDVWSVVLTCPYCREQHEHPVSHPQDAGLLFFWARCANARRQKKYFVDIAA
ncbi:hypothetical protein CCAX7_17520 [Capsulimonas corticalis]|uniref:Uncharacterized protein n=1 Tax=Capsulimonas corticalis TaxID=2219043 RepID=A0A402D3T0_9BACT|nr:hypothetical protein [Capsulimonas corticalis]BDI29701.1 hypothetical protein CCAX7_17520 [Capsulimonas corticalis]